MNIEEEVSVKDIVNFYIKINDSAKAKKDIAQLSAKDKAGAFDIIMSSSASKDFKIEVARYFIYDLDSRVRRKAEHILEDLVPGWVTDPAESILKLLKSSDNKGHSRRNAAVKFLFGIVDAGSLRDTFISLLNSRNRTHMAEIIAILEDYIDSSMDEREQVKIFEACLDIVLSDEADQNIKHHASNLLSVFFKKVQATNLGETLRRKYVEKQVEKAEGVYRYLCSGASGLNGAFLADLLRPLNEAGVHYQTMILNYFRMVLQKTKNPDEADTVLDTYPDYWNQDEPPKEEKVRSICSRILKAVDELWDVSDNDEVRMLAMRIRYGEYASKRELLEQVRNRLESEGLGESALEKIAQMLRCFLFPEEEDVLKLQAAQLLLFKLGSATNRLAALDFLAGYLENKDLNYAEKGSIAAVIETLLAERRLGEPVREKALYLLFIADPERIRSEDDQRHVLGFLRDIVEGTGFGTRSAEMRTLDSLGRFSETLAVTEKLKKAAQYLEFKIKNPKA